MPVIIYLGNYIHEISCTVFYFENNLASTCKITEPTAGRVQQSENILQIQERNLCKKGKNNAVPLGLYTAKLEKDTKQGRKRERRQFFKNDKLYRGATASKGSGQCAK